MSTPSLRTVLKLLFISLLTACSSFQSVPEPSQADIEKEEQAIYSYFVGKRKGPAVILENTSIGLSADEPKQIIGNLTSSFPDLSKETLNNFLDRNRESTLLSPKMQLEGDYVLLSQESLAEISSHGNWQDILAEKYPGSQGYIIFSRVGFNKSLDQAVLYMGEVAGPLMGAGYYYQFEKQEGKWVMKKQVMVWIS